MCVCQPRSLVYALSAIDYSYTDYEKCMAIVAYVSPCRTPARCVIRLVSLAKALTE